MSNDQPGPYGHQPGPCGQQPNPYGQQQPPQGAQPGYGYPQQAPQGVPPQQPPAPPAQGYGYPQGQQAGPYGQQPGPYGQQPGPYGQQPGPYGQQPGPYGQQPGPYGQQPPAPPYGGPGVPGQPGVPPFEQPKKKRTGLIVTAVVVVLAVVAGGAYLLTSGSNSDVADSTKGYKITPPASVDDYEQDTTDAKPGAPMTGKDKSDAEAIGIKNPSQVSTTYVSGDLEKNPLTTKMLLLEGSWGEIADPAKVIDASFASAAKKAELGSSNGGSLVGSPEEVKPAGFKGALMKCQNAKMINDKADGTAANGPKEMTMPVCVWADYSTVGIVIGFDVGGAMTNKPMSQDEAAALAAKLYNTGRTKI
ncbi:hypothetical protein [Streptomyces sp. NPDC008125]|uniref:hypothetical protein n=1 Tax=Streptomyces sp. NPDC008125 TaxID=3364811 RepID=UPI0036EEC602